MNTEALGCRASCRYKKDGLPYPCGFGTMFGVEAQYVCTHTVEEIQRLLEEGIEEKIQVTASERTVNYWRGSVVVAQIVDGIITYIDGD